MKNDRAISVKKLFFLLIISSWPLYLSFSGQSVLALAGTTHYFPLRENAIRTMMEGHFPLWNSYIFCGIPLLGDAISNPLDILNIVFIFFKPVSAAAEFLSLQLFLAGTFMYVYLRRSLQFHDLSALLGGVLYLFNPVLVFGPGQRLDFVNPLGSFLWLPLILLFADKALENKFYQSLIYAIFSALALSFSVFCGSINIVLFMSVFLAMYILLSPVTIIKKIFLVCVIGITTLSLTAVQVFPIYEAAKNGHRTLLWSPSNYDSTAINLWSPFLCIFEYPVNLIHDFFNNKNFLDNFISSHFKVNITPIYVGIFNLFLLFWVYSGKADTYKIKNLKIGAVAILLFLVGIYYLPIKSLLIYFFPLLKGMHLGYTLF